MEKLPKYYFQEPIKISKIITKFPYFTQIKYLSNNITKNNLINKIDNSQNKKK